MIGWITRLTTKISLNGEMLAFAPLYAWLSFINYTLKLWLTPSWFTQLETNHAALLRFEFTNNEQCRLLQFYVPELFHRVLDTTIPHSYALARLLFVFFTFACFHRYLRKWFSVGESFAGVTLLAAILPFTFMDDLQESSPLLMLLFLLALQAIRDSRPVMMIIAFFVGGLANETMLIVPSVYFFYHVKFDSLRNLLLPAGRAFLAGIPLLVTLGPVRYLNRHRPHLGGAYHWPDNVQGLYNQLGWNPLGYPFARHILFLLLLSVLFYYASFHYSRKPFFLRRASWMIPFFVAAHLITGKIDEPRQMVPLLFVIIPMVLFSLLNHATPRFCNSETSQ